MAKIIYVDENGSEQAAHLGADRPELVIGRVKTCDLVTSNLTVSRRHATITWREGKVLLRDLGSANGTFFRKQKVTEVVMEPGEPVFVGSFPISLELEASDTAAPAPAPAPSPAPAVKPAGPVPPPRPAAPPAPKSVAAAPAPAPEPVQPPPAQPVQPPDHERPVPRAFRADWKPAAAARQNPPVARPSPAPAAKVPAPREPVASQPGAEPARHLLNVDELEELLARERAENERLSDALYETQSLLVDLKSSMTMIADENRSLAVSLDNLDLENAERVRDMEELREERDRLELALSSLNAEVNALRDMAEGGGAGLEAARREIEDLKLSNRGYLKRIGKLLEEKEKGIPGGAQASPAAMALLDGLNELAAAALAGLDAAAGAIADADADAIGETLAEVRLMIGETVQSVARIKKDVQELGHCLKDTFKGA